MMLWREVTIDREMELNGRIHRGGAERDPRMGP